MLKIIISKATLCLFLSLIRGVFGAHTDEVKSVSVKEGDSVTLNTDVTEVQRTDQILWMFGPRETRIAEIYKQNIDMFDSNVTFGDRLKIDSHTGSLTITDIRNEHSGPYMLNIISSRRANSYKKFNVAVYALPVPVISSNYSNSLSSSSSDSSCSVLCLVLNVSAVSLSWYKGNSVLSSISVSDLSISLSLPLEVEYQDNSTYSCVANNTITNHTTHLNTEQFCQTKTPPTIFLPSFISALALAGLAAAVYFLYIKQKKKKVDGGKPSTQRLTTAQTEDIKDVDIDYAEATFCSKNKSENNGNGTEEIIYSSVAVTDSVPVIPLAGQQRSPSPDY